MSNIYERLVRRVGNEKGSALVLTAGMMVVLTGFMGLALDVGNLYHHRRVLQTAADAGALGGGTEIYRGQTALVTPSALSATAENGYAHGSNGVSVTVNRPPLTGPYAADPDAVEVLIAQPSPTHFMRIFGWTTVPVPARAVAWAGADDKNCVYVLENTDQDAFSYNSSAQLTADCGLRVNSSDTWGTHLTSSASVTVETATLTGGYVEESSSALNAVNGIQFNAWPRSPDPLAHLAPPPSWGCDFVDLDLDLPAVVLTPGVYCGKLTVKNNTMVTLTPGIYVIKGGPFTTESNARVSGTGVTFFLTDGGGYSFAGLSELPKQLGPRPHGPHGGSLYRNSLLSGSERRDSQRHASVGEQLLARARGHPLFSDPDRQFRKQYADFGCLHHPRSAPDHRGQQLGPRPQFGLQQPGRGLAAQAAGTRGVAMQSVPPGPRGRRPRHLWRNERGSELIELSLVGILLFTLVFGIMELGRAVWIYDTVAHLAREGARYAIVRGAESSQPASAADVDAHLQTLAGGMTGYMVTTNWTPDNEPGSVVQVRVDRPFDPIVPLVGLPPITLSSTSQMVISF